MPVNSDPKPSASPIDSDIKAEPVKTFDLSVTQVVGGALAAMTAAALGSRLSVAGTVVGAALASIIAAVAGAMYTASLRRTRDKVRSVWTGTAGGTATRVEVLTEESAAGGSRCGRCAGTFDGPSPESKLTVALAADSGSASRSARWPPLPWPSEQSPGSS